MRSLLAVHIRFQVSGRFVSDTKHISRISFIFRVNFSNCKKRLVSHKLVTLSLPKDDEKNILQRIYCG
jgi:hypothetical protein